MGIVGLQTEKVSPPHDPDAVFVLRTALSPYVCERARQQLGFAALGGITDAVGSDGANKLLIALQEGQDAKEIADRLNQEMGEETPEESEDSKNIWDQFDLDYAAYKLIKAWSYRDEGRKIPVKLKYVRDLDAPTRLWLHDKAKAAMRLHLPEDVVEGNSSEPTST